MGLGVQQKTIKTAEDIKKEMLGNVKGIRRGCYGFIDAKYGADGSIL